MAVLRLAPGQPVFALVKSIALDRVVRPGADPSSEAAIKGKRTRERPQTSSTLLPVVWVSNSS